MANMVPSKKEALNRFKMECASEVGVTLNQGYNGDLSSKQAGSIGGQRDQKDDRVCCSEHVTEFMYSI